MLTIDREKTVALLDSEIKKQTVDGKVSDVGFGLVRARLLLVEQTEVEVAPVIHAHWINKVCVSENDDEMAAEMKQFCSHCDQPNKNYTPPFCPHCGSVMDEKPKKNY